jgi:hypothetical protein
MSSVRIVLYHPDQIPNMMRIFHHLMNIQDQNIERAEPPTQEQAQQAHYIQEPEQTQESSVREMLEQKGIIIPEEYICPITMDIMQDPVVTSDGHVYEKRAIQKWLLTNNKSPLTNCEISKEIIPCHAFRNLIQKFIELEDQVAPAIKIKKRKASVYNLYVKQQFPIVQQAHPELKTFQVMQIIAQQWKQQKK